MSILTHLWYFEIFTETFRFTNKSTKRDIWLSTYLQAWPLHRFRFVSHGHVQVRRKWFINRLCKSDWYLLNPTFQEIFYKDEFTILIQSRNFIIFYVLTHEIFILQFLFSYKKCFIVLKHHLPDFNTVFYVAQTLPAICNGTNLLITTECHFICNVIKCFLLP